MKKLLILTAILFTLTVQAKDSKCIEDLNTCRAKCYAEGIQPDGECILKCYKDADKCRVVL